jgi:3-methyladenine DNA glycosylase/8-oxoguanine DNA glycosylase
VLPTAEPRVRYAAALAYDRPGELGPHELEALAEPWRPLRSWVCLLLRAWLADGGRGGEGAPGR